MCPVKFAADEILDRLIWGAILMLTAVCFNAQGLLANRFFLGVSEACIGPGLTVIVAMWYKRSEQPLRMGAWFMGNVIAGFVGGIVAYGVGHVKSIEPWKVCQNPPVLLSTKTDSMELND